MTTPVDVNIRNVIGTVKAVDGDSLLSPQTLDRIVQAVLASMDDKHMREKRAKSDTKVTAGVASEQDAAS